MAGQNEFVEYLIDMLGPMSPVKAKAMFGGYGIFKDGLMFGLVSQETLYLKADRISRLDFDMRGLKPFNYRRKGRDLALSYYQAPLEALDDDEELLSWAEKAYDAAIRSAGGKSKKV